MLPINDVMKYFEPKFKIGDKVDQIKKDGLTNGKVILGSSLNVVWVEWGSTWNDITHEFPEDLKHHENV